MKAIQTIWLLKRTAGGGLKQDGYSYEEFIQTEPSNFKNAFSLYIDFNDQTRFLFDKKSDGLIHLKENEEKEEEGIVGGSCDIPKSEFGPYETFKEAAEDVRDKVEEFRISDIEIIV